MVRQTSFESTHGDEYTLHTDYSGRSDSARLYHGEMSANIDAIREDKNGDLDWDTAWFLLDGEIVTHVLVPAGVARRLAVELSRDMSSFNTE